MSKKKKPTKRQAAQRGTKADAGRVAAAKSKTAQPETEEQEAKGYGRKALLVIAVLLVLWIIQSVIGS